MICKIRTLTQSKPCSGTCSCHLEKISVPLPSQDINKEGLKSQLFVVERSRLPGPVHYTKQYAPKIQELTKRSRWRSRKQPQYDPKPNPDRFNICRWYKRRKAFNDLIKENKRKEKEIEKQRREEWERERVNEILRWEYGKRQREVAKYEERKRELAKYEQAYRPIPLGEKINVVKIKETQHTPRSWSPVKRQKGFSLGKTATQKTRFKDRSANAKPRSVVKQVSVKKYSAKDSMANRFVGCCYRVCCQFYCCLTCLLVIALAIILLL